MTPARSLPVFSKLLPPLLLEIPPWIASVTHELSLVFPRALWRPAVVHFALTGLCASSLPFFCGYMPESNTMSVTNNLCMMHYIATTTRRQNI